MDNPVFSVIIPTINKDSQKLQDLIASIKAQSFDQKKIEILVITEGTAESAKAIGIRKAKGSICVMLCDDNFLTSKDVFQTVFNAFERIYVVAAYSKYYFYRKKDNALNRYFSLIGNNDPIAFYLGKCDRKPYYEMDKTEQFSIVRFEDEVPTLGENGFFFRKEILEKADLDHYSHIDVTEDLRRLGYKDYLRIHVPYLWHRTADSLLSILKKRYKYGRDLYCKSNDRRWKMLSTKRDYWRLLGFILSTLLVIPCLYTSIKGFSKIKDGAWFYHYPVCLTFLITYGVLWLRWKLRVL